jgi:hypothetical protein
MGLLAFAWIQDPVSRGNSISGRIIQDDEKIRNALKDERALGHKMEERWCPVSKVPEIFRIPKKQVLRIRLAKKTAKLRC